MTTQLNYNQESIITQLFEKLKLGAEKANHEFHTFSFATIYNSVPKIRTVVLRKVDIEKGEIIFHTDIRSGKIAEIAENPMVSCLFYSRLLREQIRIEGNAKIFTKGELFEKQWLNSLPNSRKCYLAENAPSSKIDKPISTIPEKFSKRNPTSGESESGKKNFAVVTIKIEKIDWLYLRSGGHIRALFRKEGNDWLSNWLVP
ncbi:MAG: pyridoxamine 5'-phosphate oxidase family protein [Melioribacteraceae bacterium]|nr:pyridoxamine 5'-phosphate oxidase family protein [Melioribacteraceae bacterium]MCF8265904.1 pyridoxamine 5'-phosphate oxidase family protein [Melioribacteraceae bacterium]